MHGCDGPYCSAREPAEQGEVTCSYTQSSPRQLGCSRGLNTLSCRPAPPHQGGVEAAPTRPWFTCPHGALHLQQGSNMLFTLTGFCSQTAEVPVALCHTRGWAQIAPRVKVAVPRCSCHNHMHPVEEERSSRTGERPDAPPAQIPLTAVRKQPCS